MSVKTSNEAMWIIFKITFYIQNAISTQLHETRSPYWFFVQWQMSDGNEFEHKVLSSQHWVGKKKSTILGICTTNPTILFQEQALGSPLAVWSQWCIRGKCCARNVATSTWCHKLSHKHCSEKAWQASPKDPTACPMVAVNAPLSAKYGNILAYCLQLFTRLGSVEQNKYLSRQD